MESSASIFVTSTGCAQDVQEHRPVREFVSDEQGDVPAVDTLVVSAKEKKLDFYIWSPFWGSPETDLVTRTENIFQVITEGISIQVKEKKSLCYLK